MSSPVFEKRQIAALPLFVDPKGNPIAGLHAHEAALGALEEADLPGKVERDCIGSFAFNRRREGGETSFLVDVYALLVHGQLRRWAEIYERRVLRCNAQMALDLVCSPSLAALVSEYVSSIARARTRGA